MKKVLVVLALLAVGYGICYCTNPSHTYFVMVEKPPVFSK